MTSAKRSHAELQRQDGNLPASSATVESPGGYRGLSARDQPSAMIGASLHTHAPSAEAARSEGLAPSGFLGPTSYSAVFRENDLGNTHEDFVQQRPNLNVEDDGQVQEPRHGPCNLEAQEHVDEGIMILQRFPERHLCEYLLGRYFEVCDVHVHEQTMYYCHDSIWSTYGEYLQSTRKDKDLEIISKELCKTAMTPLPSSSNTQEWLDSFSGKRLRWEVLGTFFAVFGLAVMTMPDWDPLFYRTSTGRPSSKMQYGKKVGQYAEACLALCNDVDSLNDYVISLMYLAHLLQSFNEGDTSM